MRRRRGAALLVLAPIAMLAVPRDALASPACSGPWIPTYRSPPGCPLIAVSRDPLPPTVEVWRNGELVADAVATIVTTNIQLDVSYSGPTCAGDWEVQEVRSEPFVQHSIEVSDTQPGDEVLLDQFFGAALIEQPGPCYAVSLPRPECYASQMATPCPDDDDDDIDLDAGCNASGGSAHWLVVLLALAFVRRRR